MADIFISYARSDIATAQLLADALGRRGWTVFWDRHIPAGKRFDQVIAEELGAARCVIALWSKAGNQSEWVLEEADYAKRRHILTPARIEAVDPPFGFGRIHAADLICWTGDPSHSGFRQLIDDVTTLIGTTAKTEIEAPPEQSSAATPQPPRKAPKKRRWTVLVSLIVVMIGGLAAGYHFLPPPKPEQDQSSSHAAQAVTAEAPPDVKGMENQAPSAETKPLEISGDVATQLPEQTSQDRSEEPVAESTPPHSGFEIEEMDATYVVTTTSNVRAEPTVQSDRLGRLPKDSGINVTGGVKGKNWYRIAYEGAPAYVHASLLQPIDAAELAAWQKIANSDNTTDYENFLKDDPNGYFSERAKQRLLFLASVPDDDKSQGVDTSVSSSSRRYEPGETFKDCDVCPEMVVVPAGSFMMGSPASEKGRYMGEEPQHRVTIANTFALAKHEVTFAEWDACVNAGGCNGYRPYDQGWGHSQRPVINVTWQHAQSYVTWLSDTTGKDYRLPSEAEWEYATRAGTTTPYTFGKSITASSANFNRNVDKTTEVGSYPANPWGLYDMHGNVWEWVDDVWHYSYRGAPNDGSAWVNTGGVVTSDIRVMRGGSWLSSSRDLRSAKRVGVRVGNLGSDLGFRAARTLN